jgi:hypothetical protein
MFVDITIVETVLAESSFYFYLSRFSFYINIFIYSVAGDRSTLIGQIVLNVTPVVVISRVWNNFSLSKPQPETFLGKLN